MTTKLFLLIPIYLLITTFSFSQNTNTFENLLQETIKLRTDFKFSQALETAKRATIIANKQNNQLNIGNSYYQLGIIYSKKEHTDSAFINYQIALSTFSKINNTNRIAAVCNSLSGLKRTMGEYIEGLNYASRAASLFRLDTLKNNRNIAVTYLSIANLQEELLQLDSAIYYNQEAIRLLKKESINSTITSYLADAYYGIGNRLSEKEDYAEANQYYNLALIPCKKINDQELEAMIIESLALNAMKVDSYFVAKIYFKDCESISLIIKDSIGLASIYNNLSFLSENVEKLDDAFSYAEKAKTFNIGGDEDLTRSIFNQHAAIQVRIKDRQENIILILSLIAIFTLLCLFYFWYKRKQELEQELELTRMERASIKKEKELINTRERLVQQQIANAKQERQSIEVRKALLQNQEELIEKEKEVLFTRRKLTEERDKFNRIKHSKVKNRIIIIKNILESLHVTQDKDSLQKAKINVDYLIYIAEKSWDEIEQLNKFNKPKSLKAFAEDMLWKAKILALKEIELIVEFDDIGDFLLKPTIQEISDEIILNAFINISKYANCKNPQLIFNADDRGLIIEIIDDGKGFDIENIREGAQGLKDMETAAKNIGGTFKISSTIDVGTQIKIILPAPFHE